MKKIRLLLIEDNRLLREGLIAMLKNQRELEIFTTTGRNGNIVRNIKKLKPHVILLDSGLKHWNSLHVVEMVKKELRDAKVIVMDLAPVRGDLAQIVMAGADGFVLKDATPDEFFTAIRAVARGDKALPSQITESLFSQIVPHAMQDGMTSRGKDLRMTSREREVIGLVDKGLTNKEIGLKLHISICAVKSHINNIIEKIAFHTRTDGTS